MPSDTLNATAQAAAPYDEMFGADGGCRPQYEALFQRLDAIPAEELRRRQKAAGLSFLHQGIAFAVYGREEGTERIFPYDLLPRIITGAEWETLARGLKIPCRYVSGHLFHRVEYNDRPAQDATHAWAEALLPGLGWVGFDPTNNLLAGERHIRVAAGRDYADVPPTRGVFKGAAESELSVAVQVKLAGEPDSEEPLRLMAALSQPPEAGRAAQQQRQQQQ